MGEGGQVSGVLRQLEGQGGQRGKWLQCMGHSGVTLDHTVMSPIKAFKQPLC